MFVRLDSMGESIIGLESRMQEMSEQSVKLEKMIETMIREQERYLEPQRKQTLARRRSSVIFRSVPALNTLDFATAAPLTGEGGCGTVYVYIRMIVYNIIIIF